MNDMTEPDTAVVTDKPPHDVCIYITNVSGTLEFEGHMNPDKAPETVDKSALVFTAFIAEQLPMLMQMAAASAKAKAPSALVDADGVQIET